ncbi:MAG TPA: ABC transporter ATP-binding protein [Candidatus Binatia bacterium]|nr:ABC transporter ATP-binding protein [Candidatus Binatia bacterium]
MTAVGTDPVAADPVARDALLSVRDLRVEFSTTSGIVHAVNGVTFELATHETLGVVGESGCGKSVTSLAMLRLLPKPAGRIAGGEVYFSGIDLVDLPDDEMRDLRGREIAMIFQDPMTSLNPVITIGEQLTEAVLAHRQVKRAEAEQTAVEMLELVGIPFARQRLKSYPHQFSGGMRQRVMIAMALALGPKLLIADEPTTALDVTIQAQILDLIRHVAKETGTAVMLITHDLGVVAGMTQRIQVMYAGRIVETATTAELFAHPRHPYTVGLLRSIPRLDAGGDRELISIEGLPPDLTNLPAGCPFAARCAWAIERCGIEDPALEAVEVGARLVTTGPNATHRVACWNPATDEEAHEGVPATGKISAAAAMASGRRAAKAASEAAEHGERQP